MEPEVTRTANAPPAIAPDLPNTGMAVTEEETAQRLSRIWHSVLGVELTGFDQNYFDLGGDSSLAVHLFAQIENVFKVKLPLATLFEAPTVREMARMLRSEVAPSSWSPLVAIQASGSRAPFFCIHGAGGNVLIYRELSRALGPEQPFYGLQCQGLDGDSPPLATVEEMAALYVKAIRRQQPHGPYLVGGYCGGGLIAYEVAQQLRTAGEEIALLALFDTMNFSRIRRPSFWGWGYYAVERVFFHIANFWRLDIKGRVCFFREKMQVLGNRLPVWWGMILTKLGGNSEEAKSESRVLGRIWEANDRACEKYVPQPFPGVVTDFRPLKQYRAFDRQDAKWDQLALQGQEIVILPVYPAGMLLDPFVKHLAIALEEAIDKAIPAISNSR
ncbi:MAG TPA: thioesterase domain-containing protein [Candidatus Limnocylindrales bacterium]|nr:thioesterase domain-containing protein [Candidatus Limnocylindrales bacterium]